jgi:hypothetical protein
MPLDFLSPQVSKKKKAGGEEEEEVILPCQPAGEYKITKTGSSSTMKISLHMFQVEIQKWDRSRECISFFFPSTEGGLKWTRPKLILLSLVNPINVIFGRRWKLEDKLLDEGKYSWQESPRRRKKSKKSIIPGGPGGFKPLHPMKSTLKSTSTLRPRS